MGLGKPVQQRAAQNPVAAADVQQTADLDSGGPHDAQHQIDLVRGERHTATNPLEEFRRQRRIPPHLIRRLFDHESSRFSHPGIHSAYSRLRVLAGRHVETDCTRNTVCISCYVMCSRPIQKGVAANQTNVATSISPLHVARSMLPARNRIEGSNVAASAIQEMHCSAILGISPTA